MFTVEQQQWEGLDNFRELVKQASCELADSIETGMMSDSKTAVFKVREASKTLDLPEELASQFEELGRVAWRGITSGDGVNTDVYTRASTAIGVIGQIERLLDSITVATT